MIKNLLKITLGTFALCTWFLALNAIYATCTADPLTTGFVCANEEYCDLVWWCLCDGNPIAYEAQCILPPVGGEVWADGITWSVSYLDLCTDADNCICNGTLNIIQWAICLSDGNPTIMTANGICEDPDACICDGLPVIYGGSCSAFPPSEWDGDTTPPTLTAWAVTNTGTATPNFAFTSNEAGIITYSWACTSVTTGAGVGVNTVTFNPLATGTYNNCTLRVTDASSNASLRLAVPTFTLTYTWAIPPGPWTEWTSGWGWGWSSQPHDNCTLPGSTLTGANLSWIDYSPSYYDGTCGAQTVIWSPYSTELNNAYLRAYSYGITTMDTIQKANMWGPLLRSHLAKMISNFAINIGGRTPDTSLDCDFVDVSHQSEELQWYITLACQLGIMGINTDGTPNTQFNPNDVVDRAQFGTILSRVIWWAVYNDGNPWYSLHLNALQTANIMTLISQPYKGEIRGYAMIMMRRTYEEWHLNN